MNKPFSLYDLNFYMNTREAGLMGPYVKTHI